MQDALNGLTLAALLSLATLSVWTILGVSFLKALTRGDGPPFSGRVTICVAFVWALFWVTLATIILKDLVWRELLDALILAILAAAGAVGLYSQGQTLRGKDM